MVESVDSGRSFNPVRSLPTLASSEAAMCSGDAEGGFDWWDEANVQFTLRAAEVREPYRAHVLGLPMATATLQRCALSGTPIRRQRKGRPPTRAWWR
jgi:hypothetical protein